MIRLLAHSLFFTYLNDTYLISLVQFLSKHEMLKLHQLMMTNRLAFSYPPGLKYLNFDKEIVELQHLIDLS